MDKKELNENNNQNDKRKDLNTPKDDNSTNGEKGTGHNNKGKPPTQSPKQVYTFLFMALGFTIAFNFLMTSSFQSKNVQISYDTFVSMVESDYVEEVELQYDKLIITPKEDKIENINADYFDVEEVVTTESTETENVTETTEPTDEELFRAFGEFQRLQLETPTKNTLFYTGRIPDDSLHQLFRDHDVKYYTDVVNNNQLVSIITDWVLPMLLTYGILIFVMVFITKKFRGDGGLGIGKSKAKLYVKEDCTGVTFDDVAGQDEAKESLSEIVDFLHNPEKYREIGARQPKGALLVGPPGTGKTLLAKAVAGESNAAFLSISGSEFIEMYVGVGATRVRDLFTEAKKNSPCIIFIDEIDAIGKSRDNQYGGNDEREQTLNQLLSELDGFDSRNAIVILAATNRPEILDKALLRPGRFDRQVIVERPDLKGRVDILNVHIKKVKFDKNIDLKKIALATTGLTGADLANIINEAALLAVREGRKEVHQKDLIKAVEIIVGGKEKKENHISIEERKLIAYHEIGHALTSALQENSTPIQRITIVPRTNGVLGFAWYTPEEEKVLKTKNEIVTEIITSLGGRAAEVVGLNMETTGASNDIERATINARTMVTMFGMSETFKMMGIETVESRYLGGRSSSNCSDITLAQVDSEVNKILDECFQKAKELLTEYKQALIELSETLLEKENIDGKDFMLMLKKYKPDLVIEEEDPQITIEDIYQVEKDKKDELVEQGVSIEIDEDIKPLKEINKEDTSLEKTDLSTEEN